MQSGIDKPPEIYYQVEMLGKILSRFQEEKEEIELELGDAPEKLRAHREEELESVDERSREIRQDVEKQMEELGEYLEDLEDYDDYKSRSVVEDVVGNIVSSRKKMIEDFSVDENPRQLHSVLNDFIQEFETLSQKEAAVMDEINLMKELSSELDRLKDVKHELEEFLEDQYRVKESLDRLEELADEREKLQDEKERLEEELENTDSKELETEIDSTEKELHELRKSGEWEDYQELRDKAGRLEEELENREKEMKKEMSKMERGLKKLLYEASKTSFGKENIQLLEKIRDGRKDEVLQAEPGRVEEAGEKVLNADKPDDLEETGWEKLAEGAGKLAGFTDYVEERNRLREEIKSVESEAESHPAVEREEELEAEKKDLERELSDERSREKELGQRLEDLDEELVDNRERTVSELEKHFSAVKMLD